jgi:hypothetical protein
VANGHRGPPGEAASLDPGARVRDRDVLLDVSDDLEENTRQALVRNLEILGVELDDMEVGSKEWGRVANAVLTATRLALGTQVRVDEQKLRRKQHDRLPEIFKRIEEAKAMLGARVLNLQAG